MEYTYLTQTNEDFFSDVQAKPVSENEAYFILGFAVVSIIFIWGMIVKAILDSHPIIKK